MAPGASRASEVRPGVLRLLTAACTGNLHLLKKLAKQLDDGRGMARTVAVCKDMRNRGALHFAVMEGKIEVCKYLLEELELDVDPVDIDGQTPLFHAARSRHTETAKYLIEQGANPAMPEKAGAIELLKFLLSKGVHVDSQSNFGTPLIQAVGQVEQDAVNVLLEHDADPNAQNDDKLAPLSASIVAGSVACVKLLIQVAQCRDSAPVAAGAKLNMSWAEGGTPLLVAAYFGKLEIISCLLEAGADADIADQPIEVAAQRGNCAAVEILFLKTSKIQTIPEWSVDGILQYVPSEAGDMQVLILRSLMPAMPYRLTKEEEVGKAEECSQEKDALLTKQKLSKESREAKQKAAEAKLRGDDSYRRKDYQAALDAYTRARGFDPNDATFLSNRSICWIRLGEVEHTLVDARACRALKPDWPKAWYREGAALRLLRRFEEAANSFYEAVKFEELVNAHREGFEAARKFRGKDQITLTLNMMKTEELDA